MVRFLSLENLKSWKRVCCLITVLGELQFIVVTFIAMLFYPDGYSFTVNYFSHLGTTVTVRGKPNTVSRVLFLIAFMITGVVLIPFWIVITTLFSDKKTTRYISLLGSTLGVISSPFLMGIAIFPGDTQYDLHSLSTRAFFLLFAFAIAIYSVAILLNRDYQNFYAYIGIAFFIVIVLFIFRFFTSIGAIMQKIIVYCFIIWAAIQTVKVWKVSGPEP